MPSLPSSQQGCTQGDAGCVYIAFGAALLGWVVTDG